MKISLKLLVLLLVLPILVFSKSGVQYDSIYVANYQHDKQCAISYTFDDGLLEHYTLVYPAFEKLGIKGTFWVNGNTINVNEIKQTEKPRTSWSQLKEMADAGHEISNHGWSHKNLTKCSTEELKEEIERNDSIILAKIGQKPITYCYAGNAKNDLVITVASKNRVGTRITQFSLGSKATPESLVSKVNALLETHDWGVAMTHGITYGYDAFKNDTVLWDHLNYVKSLEDKIWIGTFKDIAAYTREQKSIRLKVQNKQHCINIVPILTLDKQVFNYPLTLVVSNSNNKIKSIIQNKKELKPVFVDNKYMLDFDPFGGKIQIIFEKNEK